MKKRQQRKGDKPWHVHIRKLLKERGALSPKEIMKELGIPESSLFSNISKLKRWGEIKKVTGKYADHMYNETQSEIERLLIEEFKIPYVSATKILKLKRQVMAKAGNPQNFEEEYEKAVRNLASQGKIEKR